MPKARDHLRQYIGSRASRHKSGRTLHAARRRTAGGSGKRSASKRRFLAAQQRAMPVEHRHADDDGPADGKRRIDLAPSSSSPAACRHSNHNATSSAISTAAATVTVTDRASRALSSPCRRMASARSSSPNSTMAAIESATARPFDLERPHQREAEHEVHGHRHDRERHRRARVRDRIEAPAEDLDAAVCEESRAHTRPAPRQRGHSTMRRRHRRAGGASVSGARQEPSDRARGNRQVQDEAQCAAQPSSRSSSSSRAACSASRGKTAVEIAMPNSPSGVITISHA